MKYGMLIDLNTCAGCAACVMACKMENGTPMGMYWAKVLSHEEGEYPNVKKRVLPASCMHCSNAPCVRVCPTGASHYAEDGSVQVNYDKCIGCRMCMGACPYNARSLNWSDPEDNVYFEGQVMTPFEEYHAASHPVSVVEKCVLCQDRVAEGKQPACVQTCITKCRVFGDLDDSDSEVSKAIRETDARVLYEEYGTEPSIYYAGLN